MASARPRDVPLDRFGDDGRDGLAGSRGELARVIGDDVGDGDGETRGIQGSEA